MVGCNGRRHVGYERQYNEERNTLREQLEYVRGGSEDEKYGLECYARRRASLSRIVGLVEKYNTTI